jgi:hypothetical protein
VGCKVFEEEGVGCKVSGNRENLMMHYAGMSSYVLPEPKRKCCPP